MPSSGLFPFVNWEKTTNFDVKPSPYSWNINDLWKHNLRSTAQKDECVAFRLQYIPTVYLSKGRFPQRVLDGRAF